LPTASLGRRHVPDADLSEISWCLSDGGWRKDTLLYSVFIPALNLEKEY
jgi:hypothetical protein